MRLPQKTEDALASCLDAVAEPLLWGEAMQRLGESIGAESCTFCSRDLQQLSALVMPISTGHEEFADIWFRNEPHAPDPHFILANRRVHRGLPTVVEHLVSTEHERRTMPYYQETARPARRDWWAMSRFWVGEQSWGMPVYRSASRGPFTPEEAQRLAILGPRLALVLSMAEKFAAFQVRSSLSGLEQARCAAFVIDARGHAVNMNRRAELLLGGDFHLSAGRLVAVDLPSNSALQRFVARGVSARRGETFVSGPIVIHCKGEARYLVEAVPMTALLTAVFSAARILLLVTPLKAPTPPSETVLRQALGLTPAEARLARALASGHDMEESAKLLGIRMTTARTQLRAIFGKSNTRRQAELVRLLTRFSGEFEAEQ